ncbi:hypothetical protein, partial [Brucella intermedia]|uniref:hypothetical protein n=1 Tax=Brucella intermedia TaxID=94625 RepID=UPI001AED496C
ETSLNKNTPNQWDRDGAYGDLSVTYQDSTGRAEDALPVVSIIDGILAGFIRGKGPGVFGSAARA